MTEYQLEEKEMKVDLARNNYIKSLSGRKRDLAEMGIDEKMKILNQETENGIITQHELIPDHTYKRILHNFEDNADRIYKHKLLQRSNSMAVIPTKRILPDWVAMRIQTEIASWDYVDAYPKISYDDAIVMDDHSLKEDGSFYFKGLSLHENIWMCS